MAKPSVLMIYMEPAPYIVGLVEEVRRDWDGEVRVAYLSAALTQNWGSIRKAGADTVLEGGAIRICRELWKQLARGSYSILHLAGWGHPALLTALLFGAVHSVPVVVESDTQYVPRRQPPARKPEADSARSEKLPAWKSILKPMIYPLLFGMPAKFLPGGSRQKAYLKQYGVPDRRVRIGQMTSTVEQIAEFCAGLDQPARLRIQAQCSSTSEKTKFLYVGRLETYKGILELLAAFRKLVSRRSDVALVVVGDGSLQDAVQAAADDFPESIFYLGRRDGQRLWQIYATSDVVVVPSRRDAWGLVVNEAMAAALPVIATEHVGCIDDLVDEGTNGLIVRGNIEDGLVDAMNYLAAEPEVRRSMGVRSAEKISEWTLARQAKIATDVWKELLS